MIINIGNEEEDDLGVTLWTKSLDRGGLIHVNNVVFLLFAVMELEYRKCHPHLRDTFLETLLRNEDILYLWSCISEEWSEEVGDSLIKIIAKKWFALKGYSTASAFMELYKKEQKKSVQKSRPLRKGLLQDQ